MTILFALGTVGAAFLIKSAELRYIDNWGYPSRPNAFSNAFVWLPTTTEGFVAFVLAAWIQDGFLVCSIIVSTGT